MKLYQTGVACICLGIFLLLGSFAWKAVPGKVVWNEEQALAFSEAAATFHKHTFDKSITREQMQATRDDYEAQKKQYDRALAIKDKSPTYLRIAGLVATALGIVLITVVRNN